MSSIPQAQLGGVRASIQRRLTSTAVITRSSTIHVTSPIGTPDVGSGRSATSRGGSTTTWLTVGSYPCRVSSVSETMRPQESPQAGQPRTINRFLVTLPYDTDVRTGDQIQVDGGQTLRVDDSNAGITDAAAVVAQCYRVS